MEKFFNFFIGGVLVAIAFAVMWDDFQAVPPVVIRGFAPQTKASGVLKGMEVELPSPKDDAPQEMKPGFHPATTDIAFPPIPEKSGAVEKAKKKEVKGVPRAERAAPGKTVQSNHRASEDVLIERKARTVLKKYGQIIRAAAREHSIAAKEIAAFIVIESEGNPNARSTSGAEGLMQLKPGAARDVGVKDRRNPRESIFGGAKYLAGLKRQGYTTATERSLAYYEGAQGAKEYIASGRDVRSHFYVRRIAHALRVVESIG